MSVEDFKKSLREKRRSLVSVKAEIAEMEDEITSEPSQREVAKMRDLKAKRRSLETEIGNLEIDLEEATESTSDDSPKDDPPKDDPPKDDPPKDDPSKDDPPKNDPPKDDPPKENPPVSEHWSRRKFF